MAFSTRPHPTPPPVRGGSFALRVWIVSAIVFLLGTFVLTRFLNFFISPDETANAFFARVFAETGSFRAIDVMNQVYGGVLHPRSIITDGGFLLPGSFVGLAFLYGAISKLIGFWSLTFITPVLVVLAALSWNQILQKWFSSRVAFVSSLLFLFHPAIWYYAARGLMPNVLFICCVIFAVWCVIVRPSKKSYDYFFAGLFVGLALFVRLSEVYWLIPLFGFLLFTEKKSLSWRPLLSILVGIILPMSLLLFLNVQTYGNPFTMGYSFVSSASTIPSADVSNSSQAIGEEQLSWLLPFGFHPRGVFWHTLDYLLLLFWWLTIPALCAIPLLLKEKQKRMYFFVTLGVTVWLCVWYGSWQLHDNPDPTLITIANSYVRYWLPIFILSTPLIATSLIWFSDHVRTQKIKAIVLASCVLLLVLLNVRIVFLEGPDALQRVVMTLESSMKIREQILAIVPADAVIVTDRSDKLFFPARHVMVPLRDEKTFAALPALVEETSVYYYGITLPQSDLDFLNQQKLVQRGLHIDFLQNFGIESLYKISRP